jgi:hypothetical protein
VPERGRPTDDAVLGDHRGFAAYASAALFGATYIGLSGVVLLPSVAVFSDRPSAGVGATFLLLAAGQTAGTPIASVGTMLVRPRTQDG